MLIVYYMEHPSEEAHAVMSTMLKTQKGTLSWLADMSSREWIKLLPAIAAPLVNENILRHIGFDVCATTHELDDQEMAGERDIASFMFDYYTATLETTILFGLQYTAPPLLFGGLNTADPAVLARVRGRLDKCFTLKNDLEALARTGRGSMR